MMLFTAKIRIKEGDSEHTDDISIVAYDEQDAREKLEIYAENYQENIGDHVDVDYDSIELKEEYVLD